MSEDPAERRREPRFSIGAPALLRQQEGRPAFPAITLNVSTGGVLLRLTGANPFRAGDDVLCEIALGDGGGQAFASWGIGRVARVDEASAAIELKSGIFADEGAEPEPD